MSDDGKKDEGKEEDDLKELKSVVEKISDVMTSFSSGLEALGTKIDGLGEHLTKDKTPDKDDDGDDDLHEDLERLGRKDFMGTILKSVEKMLEKKLENVSTRIESVETETQEMMIKRLIKEAEGKHKDFWEWKEEMTQLAKRNPHLTPEDAYTLARASDPDKAKEVDGKLGLGDAKDKDKEGKDKEGEKKTIFGGLTPTSGKTVSADDLEGKDAAETAWARGMGGKSDIEEE